MLGVCFSTMSADSSEGLSTAPPPPPPTDLTAALLKAY